MTEQQYTIPPTSEGSIDPDVRAQIDSIIAEVGLEKGETLSASTGIKEIEFEIDDTLRAQATEEVFSK